MMAERVPRLLDVGLTMATSPTCDHARAARSSRRRPVTQASRMMKPTSGEGAAATKAATSASVQT